MRREKERQVGGYTGSRRKSKRRMKKEYIWGRIEEEKRGGRRAKGRIWGKAGGERLGGSVGERVGGGGRAEK